MSVLDAVIARVIAAIAAVSTFRVGLQDKARLGKARQEVVLRRMGLRGMVRVGVDHLVVGPKEVEGVRALYFLDLG